MPKETSRIGSSCRDPIPASRSLERLYGRLNFAPPRAQREGPSYLAASVTAVCRQYVFLSVLGLVAQHN